MSYREYLRKLLLLATVALGVFPLAPMVFDSLNQALIPLSHLFAPAYFLLAAVAIAIPGKWRLAFGIPAAAAGVALCILFRPESGFGVLLLVTVFHAALLLLSLPMGGWEQDRELSAQVSCGLLALGLLGQVMLYADSLRKVPMLETYRPYLTGCFLALVLLMSLGMNRNSMSMASGVKRKVSVAIRRKNALMTLGLFIAAVATSFIPYIYDWIRQLLTWVLGLIGKFIAMLFTQEEATGDPSAGPGAMELSPGEPSPEPGLFLRILEFLFRALAVCAVVALLAFCLYKLAAALIRLVKKLWRMLEEYAAASSQDYVDEISDTRDTGENSRIRRSRGPTSGRWKGGSPREHVRYRFGRLLWKHREWSPGTTAREKLPTQTAEIYERARYSAHPVSEAEAENFRRQVRDL